MNSERSQHDLPDHAQAVRNRLARLRTMPVETARLEHLLREQTGALAPLQQPLHLRRRLILRPLRMVAAAAAIVIVATFVLLSTSGGPVMASPNEMAQMHQDLVNGRVAVTQVNSIADANRQLASQWPGSPELPAPQEHVMACCMKSVKNKRVACVLLKGQPDAPITMTVANAADMKMPASPTVTYKGVAYHVQSSGSLNMVSTARDGRWVCLIGEMPAERLMDVAARLSF